MISGLMADINKKVKTRLKIYNNPRRMQKGDTMLDKAADNHNFDFNIGHLVKSPCKECPTREKLPSCIDDCELLDQIQTVLSDSISCANNFSAAEPYDVPAQVLEQI
jgi:hypothetical protein